MFVMRWILCTSVLLVGCGGRTVTATTGAGGTGGERVIDSAPPRGAAGIGNSTGPGNPVGAGGTLGVGGMNSVDLPIDMGPCMRPDVFEKALVATEDLADLEGDAPGAIASVTPGGGWFSFRDTEMNTMFTPDPGAWIVEIPGNGGIGSAVHVAGTGFVAPLSAINFGAGTGFALGGGIPGGPLNGSGMIPMPTDVSSYAGISFYAKSSLQSDVSVQFTTSDSDPSYCTCTAVRSCAPFVTLIKGLGSGWTKYTVRFVEVRQPAPLIPFDPTNLLTIVFAANTPAKAFDFWIDDITLIR